MKQAPVGLAMASVCNLLNLMSKAYLESCGDPERLPIAFLDHSDQFLSHHPNQSNRLLPRVIAVPEPVSKSWYADGQSMRTRAAVRDNRPPKRSGIAWHHVLSVILVDHAIEFQELLNMALDGVASLNQARPDLAGCFGLTITRSSCRLWWSDAAGVYTTPDLSWSDPDTLRALLGYVDRLYNPLVLDASIRLADIRPTPPAPLHSGRPVWLVSDATGGAYWGDRVVYVGPPWSKRSWIVSAERYKPPGGSTFAPCAPVIIKDSFPPLHFPDSDENAILERIHAGGRFPGVSFPVACFDLSGRDDHAHVVLHGSGLPRRRKCRVILEDGGEDLYRCRSILHFLMVMYDAIEVLRQLHQSHGVLHGDISLRNILCSTSPVHDPPQPGSPAFIRHVLSSKYSNVVCASSAPACVLIDFDNAFCEGISPEPLRSAATGTAPFVASVLTSRFRKDETLHPPRIRSLEGSAKDCYVQTHGQEQYDMLSSLHDGLSTEAHTCIPPDRAVRAPRHDVESCCWLMQHFFSTALPAGRAREDKSTSHAQRVCNTLETHQIDSVIDLRRVVVKMRAEEWASVVHPRFASFGPFLGSLSTLIDNVYELLEPALHPYHLHEAVQRLLLQEICRLLDADDHYELDIRQRRKIRSAFNQPLSAKSPARKRKRPLEADCGSGKRIRCGQI